MIQNFSPRAASITFATIFLALVSIATPSYGVAGSAVEQVFFVEPKDGAQVTSPVTVEFGVSGVTVAPAGEVKEGTGHHHLIIDGAPIEKGQPVPADATHIHYGKGQTSAEIPLTPGKHTLTLQFANGAHLSYGPELSATITVNVLP